MNSLNALFSAAYVNYISQFAMIMIVVSFLATVLVSADRLWFLFWQLKSVTAESLEAIQKLILQRQYSQAIQAVGPNQDSAPELEVTRQTLMAIENGREAIRAAIGATVLDISNRCEERLPLLALTASVATLLGLLGTITGLIKTFAGLAVADAATKGQMLGEGISEAMNSTAAGLVVGIIAMVVHSLCTTQADRIVSRVQKLGYQLMNLIEQAERQ